jgi:hypothetical protein
MRISLRRMLVVMLLLQAPFIYIAYLRLGAAREKHAVAKLVGSNGESRRGTPPIRKDGIRDMRHKAAVQQFFAEHGVEDEFYSVTYLRCRNRRFDGQLEVALAELPALNEILFTRCEFKPEARLPPSIRTLGKLGFSECQLQDGVVFDSITTQQSVSHLWFRKCTLPASVSPLSSLLSLTQLGFDNCDTQIADWSFLNGLTNLEALRIHKQSNIGAMLVSLPPSLKRLWVYDSKMDAIAPPRDDAALGLRYIAMWDTNISCAEILPFLHRCPHAETVLVHNATLSDDDRDALKDEFPFVQFQFP